MFDLFKKKENQPEKPAPAEQKAEEKTAPKESWWQRLSGGLKKSTTQMSEGITAVFTKKKLDEETLHGLEELLIKADLGPAVAAKLTGNLRKSRFGKEVDDREIREALAQEIATLLQPLEKPLDFSAHKPFVLLMVGVNGTGKTTTMGKIARQLKEQGKSVLMVAADTFRAAASQQLEVWARRAGFPVITGAENADPASLAFKGLEQAKNEGVDVVMVDTAGRLHNKADLMAELQKIIKVLRKIDASTPHAALLVLDATTGQNALNQVEIFSSMIPVTHLVVTKLDGSARAGVLVAMAEKFKIPVTAIGVGEAIEDLQAFDAKSFARALCGVETV
jgi:fused signal recognition particle receptor